MSLVWQSLSRGSENGLFPREPTSSGSETKSLEESDNLADPDVLAQEIVDDLEAALEQFREIAIDLETED